jgi:hypothetical protein
MCIFKTARVHNLTLAAVCVLSRRGFAAELATALVIMVASQ